MPTCRGYTSLGQTAGVCHCCKLMATEQSLINRGLDALIAELDHIKPDLLIIDPLINVMGGVSVNDNAAAALLMGKLVGLATSRAYVPLRSPTMPRKVVIPRPRKVRWVPRPSSIWPGSRWLLNRWRRRMRGQSGCRPGTRNPTFELSAQSRISARRTRRTGGSGLSAFPCRTRKPPIYLNGDQVAVVEPFQPGVSAPAFPQALVRDALLAVDGASPPLTPSKRSSERYAAPVIADAIKRHRAGQASEMDGKAVLDHLMSAGLVAVADVKVFRGGKGSDTRKGLVLTPAGKVAVQQAGQFKFANPTPQSPQTPATTLQDDAGGDPLGPPQRQGGCGGNAGSNSSEGKAPQRGVSHGYHEFGS